MENMHHIPSREIKGYPALQNPPDLQAWQQDQPAQETKPVRGLLAWIIGLIWICAGMACISAVPDAMHSLVIRHVVDDDVSLALAFPSNDYTATAYYEDTGKTGKDYRSQAQKDRDEDTWIRVVGGDTEYWLGDDDEITEEEKEVLASYEGVVSPNASRFAMNWFWLHLLLAVGWMGCNIAVAILTMVLIYRMVYNAKVTDPQHPHSSPAWAAWSCIVPIANLFVPVRELWRAWRPAASACGLRAAGLSIGLWWGMLLVSSQMDKLTFKAVLRGDIYAHWVDLVTDGAGILFCLAGAWLFTRMRATVEK